MRYYQKRYRDKPNKDGLMNGYVKEIVLVTQEVLEGGELSGRKSVAYQRYFEGRKAGTPELRYLDDLVVVVPAIGKNLQDNVVLASRRRNQPTTR